MLEIFNRIKKQRGFTLIELLVVVSIIGVLATMVLVSLNSARMKARDVRRVADIRQVALALEMYYDNNSGTGYPGVSGNNDWSTLKTCLEGTGFAPCNVRYISSVPHDPGTNAYEYWVAPGNNGHVLKATLENADNLAFDDDVDNDVDGGYVWGCDCDDNILAYCLRM